MKIKHDFLRPYENERITRDFAAIIADELEERANNDENILNHDLCISFNGDRWEYLITDDLPFENNLSEILGIEDENQEIEYEDLVDRLEEYINKELIDRISIQ